MIFSFWFERKIHIISLKYSDRFWGTGHVDNLCIMASHGDYQRVGDPITLMAMNTPPRNHGLVGDSGFFLPKIWDNLWGDNLYLGSLGQSTGFFLPKTSPPCSGARPNNSEHKTAPSSPTEVGKAQGLDRKIST